MLGNFPFTNLKICTGTATKVIIVTNFMYISGDINRKIVSDRQNNSELAIFNLYTNEIDSIYKFSLH